MTSASRLPSIGTLGRDATAAAVVSLAAISFYISAASLLFQGSLSAHLPVAIGAALLGGIVFALIGAWRASLPLASVGAEPATVPVLATITAGVAAAAPPEAALPTAVAALALTGAAIGSVWWLMGRRGWGDLIRYIPYPVIGGFLASVGWLMLSGGMGVAMGQGFTLARAWAWLGGEADLRLAVGLLIGVLIWRVTLRSSHPLTLPGLLLLGALAIHAGLAVAGLDTAAAQARGWLLLPFSRTTPAWPLAPELLAAVHWDVVMQQAGLMLSAVIVATISLLLSDTSLEVAWDERADINRDLRALGLANLLASVAGGLVGGISISRSVLNRVAGAVTRGSGVVKAGLCALAMAWGGPVIALVPRPLLAGMLVYLGLGMLKAWLIDSRSRLPGRDHLTVVAMVAVTALAGFLPAVCVGVLACCVDFAVSSARLSPVRRLIARSAWPGKVERSTAQSEQLQQQGHRLRIVELQGVLFFGSATQLSRDIEALLAGSDRPQRLLFDFQHLRWLDTSAGQALARLFKTARRQDVQVELSQLSDPMRRTLQACGALSGEPPRLHADIDAAVAAWDDETLARSGLPDTPFEDGLQASLPAGTPAARLLSYFEPLSLAPGQLLFGKDEASDALFLVRSGRLSIFVIAQGRELQVRTVPAGGAVGEMGLFRHTPRSASARADQATEVLRLSQRQLDRLEAEHPLAAAALYRLFLMQMASRIDQLTQQANALAR